MGWSSGVDLACDTYDLVRKFIPKEKRKKIARKIHELFLQYDADGWDGNSHIEKDAGLNVELNDY